MTLGTDTSYEASLTEVTLNQRGRATKREMALNSSGGVILVRRLFVSGR